MSRFMRCLEEILLF